MRRGSSVTYHVYKFCSRKETLHISRNISIWVGIRSRSLEYDRKFYSRHVREYEWIFVAVVFSRWRVILDSFGHETGHCQVQGRGKNTGICEKADVLLCSKYSHSLDNRSNGFRQRLYRVETRDTTLPSVKYRRRHPGALSPATQA